MSLAQHIIDNSDDRTLRIQPYQYIKGDRLRPGQISKSGLYGIISNLNKTRGLVLRITLFKDAAELMADAEQTDRYLEEIWLV
jgi:hypothetical protein